MENDPSGLAFMWGGPACDLLLPPLPPSTEVVLAFRPARGDAPLTVLWNGEDLAEIDVDEGQFRLRIDADRVRADRVNQISFRRATGYPPGGGDHRPLAVQLFEVWVQAPNLPWSGSLVGADGRERIGVELSGHHSAEQFGANGSGVWLKPVAKMEVPAGVGRLFMDMWAPRPVPPNTVIRASGETIVGPLALATGPQLVVVPIADRHVHGGTVQLELESAPYSPAAAGHGADDRQLGVVVSGIRFEPAAPPAWALPLD
jgi:hypothetical protein